MNAYHLQAGQDGVGWPGGGRHPRGLLVTHERGMHFQKRYVVTLWEETKQ